MVLRLYTETANGFLGGAEKLGASGLGWDAAEWAVFAAWLPRCGVCKTLDLQNNPMADAGLAALAAAAAQPGALPALETLYLNDNQIADAGLAALAEAAAKPGALPALEELHLEYNQITDA